MTFETRPRFQSARTAYARTTRIYVITLTDHRDYARAQLFSKLVVGCHVANCGLISSHTTFASMIRLLAIAFMAEVGEAARRGWPQ